MTPGEVRQIEVADGKFRIGGAQLALIAGPCLVEDYDTTVAIAQRLAELATSLEMPLIFKASYDKANRTSLSSPRGPGCQEGLEILAAVKEASGLPLLTDVHETVQVAEAAQVADILQIPAFLCRQTDLLVEAGRTGLPVNIKKFRRIRRKLLNRQPRILRSIEGWGLRNTGLLPASCMIFRNLNLFSPKVRRGI